MPLAYEIYREETKRLSIEVKDGRVQALSSSLERGTAARVINNGRLGFAYSTDLKMSESDLMEKAVSASLNVEADLNISLPPPSGLAGRCADVSSFDRMAVEEKIDLAKALEDKVLKSDPKIRGVRKAVYEEAVERVRILNSNGVDAGFLKGLSSLTVTAVAEDDKGSEWATEVEYSKDPADFNVDEIAEEAALRAVSYLNSRRIPSCRCRCILDRRVVADLLHFIAPAFFADAVVKGRSPLAGKIGQKVYSPAVTLIDDVTDTRAFSPVPFDAEGSPAGKNLLIEKGELKMFLSDTIYGGRLSAKSTGSSTRPSISQMPRIGIQNLYITPGDDNLEELKREMERGFYITSLMGLHTANQITGDFSVGAAGFWVEAGREAFGVKGVTIAGNLHELLRRVIKVASDLKFRHLTGGASLFIDEAAVSGI